MFQTNVVEKIKTHILCSITFFPHVRPGRGPCWRRRARQGRPGESFVGWPAVEFAGESSLKPFAPIRSYRREEEELFFRKPCSL
jgi:hypothetical protein